MASTQGGECEESWVLGILTTPLPMLYCLRLEIRRCPDYLRYFGGLGASAESAWQVSSHAVVQMPWVNMERCGAFQAALR
jgi:hypothetical protein